MRPVGYLLNTTEGLAGEPGLFYDYIIAENGLFIRGASPHLKSTILIAPAKVRGLLPLKEKIELSHGKIPLSMYDLALSVLAADPYQERYLSVVWEDGYHLKMPAQEGGRSGVEYERLPGTILDIHSHGKMSAFFSDTDDRDEQAHRLYMVVGKLDTLIPEVEMRIGVYGYFAPLNKDEVFQ